MDLELTVLGSGSALPTSKRLSTAQVLRAHERFFLIDCSEGTQLQLRNAKVKFGKLNHICISHLHGDHVFGIFGLLSTFNLLGRKQCLTIFGPPGFQNILDFYRAQFAEEIQFPIKFIPNKKGDIYQVYSDKSIEIYTFPLRHRVSAWGYLFRQKQKEPNIIKELIQEYSLSIKDILKIKDGEDYRKVDGTIISNSELVYRPQQPLSYAFCSDTAYYERIVKWVEGVDLLYHEATFAEADRKIAKQTGHSTASQAGLIANKASVGKLLIGHYSNRYPDIELLLKEAKTNFANTELAYDLAKYPILKKP